MIQSADISKVGARAVIETRRFALIKRRWVAEHTKYNPHNAKLVRTRIRILSGTGIMLTHIVIWKYRTDIEPEVREDHVRLLSSLGNSIKQVRSLSVGFDVLGLPRSFDTGLVAIFDDRASLDAYTTHPEHIKVAEFGRSISEQVASVDFES